MLEQALAYARRGWSIIPGGDGGSSIAKEPRIPSWTPYKTRRASEDEIRAWWGRWPDANILLICGRISGIVAVDVDPDRGGTADGLPNTGIIFQSGGGGFHYLYEHPEDRARVQNQVGKGGIDVRADGGYIVAPPSVHPLPEFGGTGKTYTVVRDEQWLGKCPQFALEKEKQEDDGEKKKQDKWIVELFEEGIVNGIRNNSVTRIAGYLAKMNIPADISISVLMALMAKQKDPLDRDEVEVTVRSVYRTH